MKKLFYTSFTIILVVSSLLYSQQGWFWQNPIPQGNHLFDISFFNENIGYAVGFAGTVIKTTNGGTNWVNQFIGVTNHFMGVSVIDQNTVTVVGDSGIILKTTNGGEHWIVQSNGTTSVLSGVYFVDESNGIAVGTYGTILRTTNGGTMHIWLCAWGVFGY